MKMQLKFQEEHQSKNQYDVAYKHQMMILFKVVVDKAGTGYSKGRPLHGKEQIL